MGKMTHYDTIKGDQANARNEKRCICVGATIFGKRTLSVMTHSKVTKLLTEMEKDALWMVPEHLAK
jgi:hypothetical protein